MIMEMNAKPEPEWALKFQEYLINELNISRMDSIYAIGTLHSLIRKYKEHISEEELNHISYDATLTDEAQEIFKKCLIRPTDKPIQYYIEIAGLFQEAYKIGYRQAEKNHI